MIGFYEFPDGTVWKRLQGPPRGPREMEFYQEVFTGDPKDNITLELRKFLPHFRGTIFVENSSKYNRNKLICLPEFSPA